MARLDLQIERAQALRKVEQIDKAMAALRLTVWEIVLRFVSMTARNTRKQAAIGCC